MDCGLNNQHRDLHGVADRANGGAVDQVLENPVAMGAHHQQVGIKVLYDNGDAFFSGAEA